MKICMYSVDEVFKPSTGGVKRFAELMNALCERGHDITLYSADPADVIRRNGYSGECIYSGRKQKNIKRIASLIKNASFERVIVFDVRAAAPLMLHGIKNVCLFLRQDFYLYRKLMLEDQHANRLRKALYLRLLCLCEYLCLKNSEKIIVQCQFDADGIAARHPALKKRIASKTTIQINNANPSWAKCMPMDDPSCASRYDVAFVGNFKDSRKGHDLLIPALLQLSDEGCKLKAAIVGAGKQLQHYQNLCKDYPEIEFLGRLDNPAPVIRSARLMIVPSHADSCPNTVMEALNYNVPVIGANTSGIPEILNNPEWLFDMDIPCIKRALKRGLQPEINEEIRRSQDQRREELTFDWGKRMAEIVEA